MKTLSTLVALLLLSTAPLAQQTFVVDTGGGGDFTGLNAALAACADGDTLRVRPGQYDENVVIDGLAVSIEGAPSARVFGNVRVRNLAAEQRVRLRGLELVSFSNMAETLVATSNRGSLAVERCRILGGTGAHFTSPETIILVGCANVTFERCTAVGGTTALGPFSGSALNIQGSNVFASGCTFTGGAGSPNSGTAPGGPGVQLFGGTFRAFGCTLVGGAGAQPFFFSCGSAGGVGLRLIGTDPFALLVGGALLGGAGVAPGSCAGQPDGAPSEVLAGTVRVLNWPMGLF